MKIALFWKKFLNDAGKTIIDLISILSSNGAELYLYKDIEKFLEDKSLHVPSPYHLFKDKKSLHPDIDFLLSIGGDGTFLQTVGLVGDTEIPVIGINTGRLGFLANLSPENLNESIEALFKKQYSIEERTLIRLESKNQQIKGLNTALNEITIHKKDMGMITIHVELDDEFLNSYWADGLIISTPTGSTAYSMSVGGPIIHPDSGNLVISPIAPHNLTIRPMVIPDSKKIRLKVTSRSNEFLVAIDSRSVTMSATTELIIEKAPYTMKFVRIHGTSFYNTLRNKLMWGIDKRN